MVWGVGLLFLDDLRSHPLDGADAIRRLLLRRAHPEVCHLPFWACGSGFGFWVRVEGLGLGVWHLRFRVQNSELSVWGVG